MGRQHGDCQALKVIADKKFGIVNRSMLGTTRQLALCGTAKAIHVLRGNFQTDKAHGRCRGLCLFQR